MMSIIISSNLASGNFVLKDYFDFNSKEKNFSSKKKEREEMKITVNAKLLLGSDSSSLCYRALRSKRSGEATASRPSFLAARCAAPYHRIPALGKDWKTPKADFDCQGGGGVPSNPLTFLMTFYRKNG